MSRPWDLREWLETDGLGGYAMGTVSGIRTRRYHALLTAAARPPTQRTVLVNGLEVWIDLPRGPVFLSSQRYAPDVTHPNGAERVRGFEVGPWPRWCFDLDGAGVVEQELFLCRDAPLLVLAWRTIDATAPARLSVRPLLSGRDHHALHQENPHFGFAAEGRNGRLRWRLYPGLPPLVAHSNGGFDADPRWYKNFLYEEERARGFDHLEDLASPGVFRWTLGADPAVLILAAETSASEPRSSAPSALHLYERLRAAEEKRRRAFPSPLARAADSYLVRRGSGHSIIAGYPWFADWGRDTFISLRGLCLAAGRLEEARTALGEWEGALSEGMLPNRFPDGDEPLEYNSVDAPLWWIIAADATRLAFAQGGHRLPAKDLAALEAATQAILEAYERGTRHGIRADDDGLLAAGEPGLQLTWMDAKVGGQVITPRIGKPVEVQALWLNALAIGAAHDRRWRRVLERGRTAFAKRFWNPARHCLHDVVDTDHRSGAIDDRMRPNQLFAVGGLPLVLLPRDRARALVEAVAQHLLTPMGLRTLAPGHPEYRPRYEGGPEARDGAYHQGTVWPWLIGPFVEAWLRTHPRPSGTGARRRAWETTLRDHLAPLSRHLVEIGFGHLPEIADAEPPHRPRGCPFQAWSLAEWLRLVATVLPEHGGAGVLDAERDRALSER